MGSSGLIKASLGVLRANKKLLVFPLLSLASAIILLAVFVLPFVLTSRGSGASASSGTSSLGPLQYVIFAFGYLLLAVIAMFFNAALILAADQAFRGERPGIAASLRATRRHAPAIVAWGLFGGTVSLIARAVDRRIPFASAIVGTTWSAVTFLALPVIVLEGGGAARGVRRAAHLFRTTWGEEVTGAVRIGLLAAVLSIPLLPVLFFGLGSESGSAMLAALAVCALWIGFVSLIISTVTGVFRVAVYHFAATRSTPPQFAGADLARSFRSRGFA